MAILLWTAQGYAEMVVIVNKANPNANISAAKLAKYYKGEAQLWEDGKRILPVDLRDANPLAVHFTREFLNMDMEMKRRMWASKIYSGAGLPPQQFNDESQVISFVASEPGAIGYVHEENVKENVKVILVDGKRTHPVKE
jgi:ABC-type phosphate transport system substrate-binding protein